MKIKEFCKKHKKKIIFISVSLITVVAVVAGVAIYFIRKGNDIVNPFGQGGRGGMSFQMSENMVGASGVTSVGITEETFPVENLTMGLEVEEVYVASNDSIEAGAKIAKFTEESIAEARKELEQTLKEADLAYRAGVIEYEQSKINAKYDYESTLLNGEHAKQVYNETIANLESDIQRAKESLAEAREQIAEYESYVNNGSYRSYFKVDEYQAIYDETLDILMDKMEEWEIGWSQVTGGGGMAGGVRAGAVGGGGNQYANALASLYNILQNHYNNLEQAQKDCDDAIANAAFDLQTLQLQLPGLEQAVIEAQQKYDTQVLQAKLTYETSLSNAEYAESDYETALEKAQSDYEVLKNDWEDAKENLALFESCVGDGYFYASSSGTVLRTMIRAGRELTSESTVFMYSNPEEMTVTVSVDQGDIASIAIGDGVYVQSTEYGSYEGIVTELNPVSGSNSRSNVTYQVTVKLTGDTTKLPANTSVTVIFGMAAVDMGDAESEKGSASDSKFPGGMPDFNGEFPEGMEMPDFNGEGTSRGQRKGERPNQKSTDKAAREE